MNKDRSPDLLFVNDIFVLLYFIIIVIVIIIIIIIVAVYVFYS